MPRPQIPCVICEQSRDATFDFGHLLADLKIPGKFAHPTCLLKVQKARDAALERRGERLTKVWDGQQ